MKAQMTAITEDKSVRPVLVGRDDKGRPIWKFPQEKKSLEQTVRDEEKKEPKPQAKKVAKKVKKKVTKKAKKK